MDEKSIMKWWKANEKMLKLAEDQKREKDQLHKRINELEAAKLEQKQALELQIEEMKEELESLQSLCQALLVTERRSNDQVQNTQRELIEFLKDSRDFIIRVKFMGELDDKPFHVAAKRVYNNSKEATMIAVELCSLWEDYLRDANWRPFKVIQKGETFEQVIDEDDEKLKGLKTEYGDEVYQAVITALNELNEHNPSGRYPIPKLWNSKERRIVSITEGVKHILEQCNPHKRKRT